MQTASFFIQVTEKLSPYIPIWCIVAVGWHGHEVLEPPLPCPVVRDFPMEVIDRVDVHPFPIDLLELKVLNGRDISQQISLLPTPVLYLH